MATDYDDSGVQYDQSDITYDGFSTSTADLRVSQQHTEVVVQGQAADLRVTQQHTEVVMHNKAADLRVSQYHVEVIRAIWPNYWGIWAK